jgi:hypothetical protein
MTAHVIGHKNLTRFDHPKKNTFGYFVRIQWKGEKYHKFFSDGVYGDRLGALAAALEWRDATERMLAKPHTERQVIGFSSRNKSGVVGVRRLLKQGRDVYEATWMDADGHVGRTSYSIARHGEKRAFRLAVRARQLHEKARLQVPLKRAPRTARASQPNHPSHPSQPVVEWPAELLQAASAPSPFDPFPPV